MSRRRLFALPGVALAALPQVPWGLPEPPPMEPGELSREVRRLGVVTHTHTWMHRLKEERLRWLEAQILEPGRRVKGGKI